MNLLFASDVIKTMSLENSILVLSMLIPLIGVVFLTLPSRRSYEAPLISGLASLASLFLLIKAALFRHVENVDISSQMTWMKTSLLELNFSLNFQDGLSTTLVLLTALLTPLCILGSTKAIQKNQRLYYSCLLILEVGMLGTFMATDLFTFYICWESVLIPMVLLIGIWGGSNRLYASVKLFLYTMLGSLPMLAALLAISWNSELNRFVTDLSELNSWLATNNAPEWAFWSMALAFAIKLPLIPVHTWLPDAHTEAPTAGSVILAGVMLKMGTYGFLRLAFPFFPHLLETTAPILGWVACIGIIWGAMMALAQTDIKRLIAYSSVSHLGTCMLGIFALNDQGFVGGQLQMLNHGISTGLLFLIFGMLYERGHVRDISAYGGLARKLPLLTIMFFIATLSSIGLPLTNGFVGEFYILMGAFRAEPIWGVLAATGVILGAVYMLRLFRLVFLGTYKVPEGTEEHMHDLTFRELVVIAPLMALVFIIGLKPEVITDLLPATASALVTLKGF